MERKVVYSDIGHLEDGASCLKAHLHFSVESEVFYKEGGGNRTKRSREGIEKFSTCRLVQSFPIRQVMVWCASSWFCHSGFTSCQLHVFPAPQSKVMKSPGSGIPEGWSLYLLKLVPRSLIIQTCCLSTSYILVRVSSYRSNVKRMVGWVIISNC